MKIFKDIEIVIKEEEILRLLGNKNTEQNNEMLKVIKEEIIRSREYLNPIVYYENIDISKMQKDKVILSNETILEGSFIANGLMGCSYIVACIITLGNEIDRIIKESFDKGDYLRGMIIDNIGTAAIEYVNKAFWNRIFNDIKSTKYGITCGFSPGNAEWELYEQKKIFKCIGEDQIGVALTEAALMIPVKSLSMVYGIGEDIGIKRQQHVCNKCSMKGCSYRVDDEVELIINIGLQKDTMNVKKGSNLLAVLRENNIFIESPCSGKKSCGKCKVQIIKGVGNPSVSDIKHLTKLELQEGFRLSCNLIIEKPIEISLEDNEANMEVLIKGESQEYDINPMIVKKYCKMNLPEMKDQRNDYKRLCDSISYDKLHIDLEGLQSLSETVRAYNFNITTTIYKEQLLQIEEGDTSEKLYGAAIDIGTTTIAVYLLNLKNGKVIDCESQVNKQRAYGADVISRINFTLEKKDGLTILRNCIVSQINVIIKVLCERNVIDKNNIYDTTIVGNTTMIHLLLGIACKNIATAPYIPVMTTGLDFKSKDIGIETGGIVSFVPGISSFVGSDITAGILSSGMLNSEKYSLLLDLGTNGEIALGNNKEIVTCSTAAGPAFEGANIKYGIGGIKGAISKIDLSKEKIYATIGNEVPIGICGSGVLDTVAELLKHKVLDNTGRMLEEAEVANEKLANRIIEIDGMKQFIIAEVKNKNEKITFTQKDVREVQLAKAAISAGIKLLIEEKKLSYEDIDAVYIGGGFGNFMEVESCMTIGLIPRELKNKIKAIGNCAGSGAKMYLLSKLMRDRASEIENRAIYIELSDRQDFQDYFMDSMML